MIKQYRIFTLDFPRIARNSVRHQMKKVNRVSATKTEPEKRSMEHWGEGKGKENWACLKPLEFRGQEHSRSKSYSGSLAVSLASRANRIKNVNCILKIPSKSRESQPVDSGVDSQGLGGCLVGGMKLSLSSIHKTAKSHQVSIPLVNNPKRQPLKLDRPIQKN